mmetsp:Transcript_9771/g.22976  ORF Transcript_9771/g.22976 Transcript_9771/m.22976 type:complete len:347 (+) Transcript_9771:137-1177(+)
MAASVQAPKVSRRALLDGDRLGQVTRLVDVALAHVGDVVGHELQRDDGEERHEELLRVGHVDDVLALALEVLVLGLVADGDDRAAAREHLLDVGLELLRVGVVARRDDDDGHELVDERDGAVLHLGRGVALGVDVGDLLKLERALEGHGEVEAPAQVEEVGGVPEDARHVEHLLLLLEHLAHLVGQRGERLELLLEVSRAVVALLLEELERDHAHDADLRGEGLGRGDADLGPGVQVDAAVRLARNGRAHRVADAHGQAAVTLGKRDGGEGVGGLARLRDGDDDVRLVHDGVAVPELGGVLDLDGDLGEVLDHVLAGEGRVPRGAARADDDARRGDDALQVGREAA